ncbi:MAG: undecaprenyl-diphosphatase UppP [Pseudanabaenaceae cyanobacterium bins.39]|nr:undecaprenyl-diphosphatase UppP [Pseudanabaenaceae cyanobacterium bins.39]
MHSITILAAISCPDTPTLDVGFTQLAFWQILILGIVQGITELLPISSTAHLRIVPSLLGWADPGTAFSAAMQLASLLAVFTFLGKDVLVIGKEAIANGISLIGNKNKVQKQKSWQNHSLQMLLGVLLGTIPIAIAGLLLKKALDACNSPLRNIIVIGIACLVMSGLLALAERYGQRGNPLEQRTWQNLTMRDGIAVGFAQAFALIPGVSRSGSTLTMGLALGMERETAAWFSFLLGLPAIILAGGLEMLTLFKSGLSEQGWMLLAIGLISASLSAYLALWGLLRYLKNHSSWIFVWYRLGLGLFLIGGAIAGWFR